MRNKILMFLLVIGFGFLFVSCGEATTSDTESESDTDCLTEEEINLEGITDEEFDFEKAYYDDYLEDDYEVLNGSSDSYLITEAGTYVLSGTITETVVINVAEDEDVRLVLVDLTIQTTENSAIVVLSADDVEISVPYGTESTLSDSSTYTAEYSEYNATIYSEEDLVINGDGILNVTANYNNGISTKDDLTIVNVTLNLTSVDDGIIGRDSLLMQDATLNLVVLGDGLISSNDENAEAGFIYIEGGTYNLVCGDDGIDAVNYIIIAGGSYYIEAADNTISSDTSVYVVDGFIELNSEYDGINA